jgi:hypothetical protein
MNWKISTTWNKLQIYAEHNTSGTFTLPISLDVNLEIPTFDALL